MEPTWLPPIKNTEDDTFRILARPNFNDIRKIYQTNRPKPGIDRLEFFKPYGWTWSEYVRECNARNLPNSVVVP